MKIWIAVLMFPVLWGDRVMAEDERLIVPQLADTSLGGSSEAAGHFIGGFDFLPQARGNYNGLIAPSDEIVPEQSGYFRLTISSQGWFSGRFVVGADTVPIRGYFNSQGSASVSIYRRVWDDCLCFRYLVLEWTVDLDLIPDSDEIEGTIYYERRGGWATDLYGLRDGYATRRAVAPQAGRYTMRLPGSIDAAVAPPGDGFGAVAVNRLGVVRMAGALADGTRMTDSAFISVDGYWPLYLPLNDGEGLLFGWLQFSGDGSGPLSGQLTWIRPRRHDRPYYPEGFEGVVNVVGGRYVTPLRDETPLAWTRGQLSVSEGNLDEVYGNSVLFLSPRKLADLGGDLSKLKLRMNARTGRFSGSFIHPFTGRKTAYAGGLFQFEDSGGGYFLGVDQGGFLRLEGEP